MSNISGCQRCAKFLLANWRHAEVHTHKHTQTHLNDHRKQQLGLLWDELIFEARLSASFVAWQPSDCDFFHASVIYEQEQRMNKLGGE